MTEVTKERLGAVGKIVLGFAGVLGLVYFGITIGENRRQIDQNVEMIGNLATSLQTVNATVASEINRSTLKDAQLDAAILQITTQYSEIIRRLDRVERHFP